LNKNSVEHTLILISLRTSL